jgi:hypothetical protein
MRADSGVASLAAWPDKFNANSPGFETHHMFELDRNVTLPFQLIGQLH